MERRFFGSSQRMTFPLRRTEPRRLACHHTRSILGLPIPRFRPDLGKFHPATASDTMATIRPEPQFRGDDTLSDTVFDGRIWPTRTSRIWRETERGAEGILAVERKRQDPANSGLIFSAEGWPSGRWRWS
jgi:hypothetical protein